MDELDSDGSCSDYEDFYDGDCEELEHDEHDGSDMFDMPGADYISSGSSLAGQLQYIYFTSILNNKINRYYRQAQVNAYIYVT